MSPIDEAQVPLIESSDRGLAEEQSAENDGKICQFSLSLRKTIKLVLAISLMVLGYTVGWLKAIHPLLIQWEDLFIEQPCNDESSCPSSTDYHLLLGSFTVGLYSAITLVLLFDGLPIEFSFEQRYSEVAGKNVGLIVALVALVLAIFATLETNERLQTTQWFSISSCIGAAAVITFALFRNYRRYHRLDCVVASIVMVFSLTTLWDIHVAFVSPMRFTFLDTRILDCILLSLFFAYGFLVSLCGLSIRHVVPIKVALLNTLKFAILMWDIGDKTSAYVFSSLRTSLLISFIFSVLELYIARRSVPPSGSRDFYCQAPQDRASILSICTFFWVTPTLMSAQKKGKLNASELPYLPKSDVPDTLLGNFERIWRNRFENKSMTLSQQGRLLLFTLVYSVQRRVFWTSFLSGIAFEMCMVLDPILLQHLLSNAEKSHIDLKYCLILVTGLSISMLIRVICMEISYFSSVRVMNNSRTLLATLVFRKGLRVPERSSDYDAGKLKNFLATDADNIGKCQYLVFALAAWISGLLALPIILYNMYALVGNSAFVAFALIFIGSYLSKWFAEKAKPISLRLQERRDIRSRLLNALLNSVKVVKLQTWEHVWESRISQSRKVELRELVRLRLFYAVQGLLSALTILSIPVGVFSWYTQVDGKILTSVECFTTLAWIQQMGWSVTWLPSIATVYSALMPCCERLIDFFVRGPSVDDSNWIGVGEEIECSSSDGSEIKLALGKSDVTNQTAIEITNGEIGYHQEKPVLSNVALTIKPEEFIVIVGGVGSGKSTLIGTMANAIEVLRGKCSVDGTRAYVSQKPFLLNDTIKNNILFGMPFDEQRYRQSIFDSAFKEDLSSLHDGDETLCGENGVQLSGGQKARICLARALYADADVYFFDDILSAVDATTGAFLWAHTLIKQLKESRRKTIVLVTHQLQYLQRDEISRILVLEDGTIKLNGSWDQIKGRVGENIKKFASDDSDASRESKNESKEAGDVRVVEPGREVNRNLYNGITLKECTVRMKELLSLYTGRLLDERIIDSVLAKFCGEEEQLEQKNEGLISWEDFNVYLSRFGSRTLIASLLMAVLLSAALAIASNIWLSIWSDSSVKHTHSQSWYIGIYSVIGFFSACMVAVETLVLTFCALNASKELHRIMLSKVIYSPLSFFDITPSGQIVNRFLQDMANIDQFVPNTVLDQLKKTLTMLTQFTLVLYFAPYVMFALPLIAIPYYFIFKAVRIAARDTRRIEAVAHSPVYSQFQDILAGKACIRAFGAEKRFEAWNSGLVEQMSIGRYANEAVNKWAQALSTQLGCAFYFSAGCVCVILASKGTVSSAQLGLTLLYASQLQRALMDYLMGLASLETNFVSVERIAQYSRLEHEEVIFAEHSPTPVVKVDSITSNWPSKGKILVQNVRMRYILHRKLILNDLSFCIKGGSKVAICGRTGCGKSTALSVLMRLYPISFGSLEIDGIDITSIPVQDLRKTIRVVTQDPLIMAGTIRSNIVGEDVEHRVADADIWEALRKVQLEPKIKKLGLDFETDEGGSNLSVGERQLLCTARAIVKRNGEYPKILFCDEATANIDLNSDEKVHQVLLQDTEATVVMICHRLQHISKFDQVIIMGAGKVIETGSPNELLSDSRSELYRLVSDFSK